MDAAWSKSYAAAALVLAKEAAQVGVAALGKTKQPLPSFEARAALAPGEAFGVMRDNLHLARALPPVSVCWGVWGGVRLWTAPHVFGC